MATLEDLDDFDRREKDEQKREGGDDKKDGEGDTDMKDEEEDDILDEEILSLGTQDIQTRKRLLENDSRIMKSELSRLSHEKAAMGEKIKDNVDKIANNRYAHLHSCGKGRYLILMTANYRTSSVTLSNCSISIPLPNRLKKVPTLTLMLHELENRLSLRHRLGKPFSFLSSAWWITRS